MKIIMICSGTLAFSWEKRYTSMAFDAAAEAERNSGILPDARKTADVGAYRLYCSTQSAAAETAALLFGDAAFARTAALDEIPMRAFRQTERPLPAWLWRGMARLRWALNRPEQPETRRDTVRRARELIALLEKADEDCVLISHPRFLRTLMRELDASGCTVARSGSFGVKPLERIRATKRSMHCGGCLHNCLLSDPGCGIGRDKAARERLRR